jgi:hypothetical protein
MRLFGQSGDSVCSQINGECTGRRNTVWTDSFNRGALEETQNDACMLSVTAGVYRF